MDSSKYDSEQVRSAVTLLATVKNVSKVSRMTGIPRSVLTSWRDGKRRAADTTTGSVGTDTPQGRQAVSKQAGATRAEKLTQKWDRSTTRSLDIVNRRLDQLDRKLRKGGTVTTEDIRGLKETAWVAGVGTDKLQILTGGATQRVEVGPVVRLSGDQRIPVRDMDAIEGEWRENEHGVMEAEVAGERYVYVARGQLIAPDSLRSASLRAIEGPSGSADRDPSDAGTVPPAA